MKIAIIGGGVSGLCAALHCRELDTGSKFEIIILEKMRYPGGLMHSTFHEGYYWDNGLFKFPQSAYLAKVAPDIFQMDKPYKQKIWLKRKFYRFPMNIKDMISSQSTLSRIQIVFDYIYSYLRRGLGMISPNLYDWLRYRITARILRDPQLEAYLYKLQGQSLKRLSPTFGEHRLQHIHINTRISKLLKTIIPFRITNSNSIKDYFVYPSKTGVDKIPLALARMCEARGIRII